MTVDNFEVHLRNRQHKERVEERLAKGGSGSGGGGGGGANGNTPAAA